jgi:hypothetical protein
MAKHPAVQSVASRQNGTLSSMVPSQGFAFETRTREPVSLQLDVLHTAAMGKDPGSRATASRPGSSQSNLQTVMAAKAAIHAVYVLVKSLRAAEQAVVCRGWLPVVHEWY